MTQVHEAFSETARERDPEGVLELLRRNPELVDPKDETLLRWISDQCNPIVPVELRPVFERARTSGGICERLALQKLASTAWYEGALNEAEAHWRDAARKGRESRDRLWLMALNNLALMFVSQGRPFASLIAASSVPERAREKDELRIEIFAEMMKARALGELHEHDQAMLRIEVARARAESSSDSLIYNRVIILSTERDLLMMAERWNEALARASELVTMPDRPLAEPVLLTDRAKLLLVRFELEPESATEILRELEEITASEHLEGVWSQRLARELNLVRWRLAIRNGESEAGESAGYQLLEHLDGSGFGADLLTRALRVVSTYPEDSTLRKDFETRAADIVLERFSRSQRDRSRLADLGEPSESDWAILANYQKALLGGTSSLRAAFASRWKPGLEAYDLLVRDGHVAQCAWCGRIRTRVGEWMVSEDITSLVASGAMTHGICVSCERAAEERN